MLDVLPKGEPSSHDVIQSTEVVVNDSMDEELSFTDHDLNEEITRVETDEQFEYNEYSVAQDPHYTSDSPIIIQGDAFDVLQQIDEVDAPTCPYKLLYY